LLCPVIKKARRIAHPRTYHAPTTTPLASYNLHVASALLNPPRRYQCRSIRCSTTAMIIGPSVGVFPSNISTCSLHAAGAMALLCAHVDSAIIRLLGCWRSDEMPRYLHVQAARTQHHA
jgi:hypothetical protein